VEIEAKIRAAAGIVDKAAEAPAPESDGKVEQLPTRKRGEGRA